MWWWCWIASNSIDPIMTKAEPRMRVGGGHDRESTAKVGNDDLTSAGPTRDECPSQTKIIVTMS